MKTQQVVAAASAADARPRRAGVGIGPRDGEPSEVGRLSMGSLTRRLSLAGLIAASAVLVGASPALAHNFDVSSTPGENEVLTTLPEEFVVTMNDNLLDLGGAGGGFAMQVAGADGLYYGDGCVAVSGSSVSMAAALGPAGDYTLTWQVISADGHTVAGEIPFSWDPAADAAAPSAGADTPPACGEAGVAPGNEPDVMSSGGPVPDAAASSLGDALWIGGAVVAVAIAIVATLLLLRRKPTDT